MTALAALALVSVLAPARQSPPEVPQDRRCHLHGRIVDERGRPIAGARVLAHGWGGNQQRIAQHGVPAQWTDPEVLTGEDGRFALRFVPPKAFQFTLQVEHDDYADLGWRWSELAEGEERAQGDTTLVRPGVIEGYLETPDGALLVEQWFIQASMDSRLPHHAGISTKHCAIDPATGAFRIDDLPPGRVRLQPWRRTGERGTDVSVTTNADTTTQAVLVFDGPDPARRILLNITGSGPAAAASSQLADGALRAVSADGVVHPFERLPARGWEYWVKDLPPGEYRVEVDDPRFERWVQENVRTGETVHARLVGRAKLRASVLGADGMPVPSYGLTIQQTAPFRTSQWVELQSAATKPPIDEVHHGLLEGSYEVRVTAPGFGPHRGTLDDVSSDAPYELVVQLAPARALRGRVVHDDGAPVTGGTVQITLGEVAGHDTPGSMMMTTIHDERGARQAELPYRDASTALDAEGAFEISEIGAAPAVVRVLLGDWIRHDVHVDLAGPSAPLVVTLPRPGSVEGRVSMAGERPQGELRVCPRGANHQWLRAKASGAGQAGVVDADGRFGIGPLLAGPQVLELISVVRNADGSGGSTRTLARVRVDVAPGAPTTYDIDLGFERPTTTVELTVTLNGEAPTEDLIAQLVPREDFDANGRERTPAYQTFGGGRCVFEQVGAGAYGVVVFHPSLWAHSSATSIEVTADHVATGRAPSLTVEVPLERRELRVLTADGAPHASSEVWISGLPRRGAGVVLETSAEGTLTLSLASGHYAAHAGRPDPRGMLDPRTVPFEWRAGEEALELRLPAR